MNGDDISNGSAQYNEYHRILLDNISGVVIIAQILYNDQGVPIDYLYLSILHNFCSIKFNAII
ncbi:hypothetical protein SPSYN_01078 [Sporotomaculum syntrophicum]|uniref:Uncharacterized protein n=1 Tax=Sporotomaculum syntrophicum TaxID=182264 RepID=A0A9D3AXE0_9FIRM|nr:hypothetical protein SPSYN_01078 [Sporotomaculum syntrophicum]